MGHLAIVGSHSVNGVSALHTELVKTTLVPDFFQLWPERFNNKTNGITQRRWLRQANPLLAQLLTNTIGDCLDYGSGRAQSPGAGCARMRGFSRNSSASSAPTRNGSPSSSEISPG